MPNAAITQDTMYTEVQSLCSSNNISTNLTVQLMQGKDLTGVKTVVKKLALYTVALR